MHRVPLRVCWLIHTELRVMQLWHRNAFTVHTACDIGWVPHNFQCSSPFGKRLLHQGAQISRKCRSQLKIPHSGPTNGRRHRTIFSRPGQLARCICAPLVSVLRVAKCVTSHLAHSPCSLLDTKQVRGKFTAVQCKPPQRAHRSVWTCVSGCFFLLAFHNYTSQQLAVQNVQLCRKFLQWPLQYWSALWSAQMFLQGTAWPAVCSDVTCCVRHCGPMAEMCCCCVQQRAGGTEGSNRTPVAVWSGRQAETEKKRDGENCTLTDKEILVRNVVFLGAFRKLRKKRLSASSCVPVRPSAWNISVLN